MKKTLKDLPNMKFLKRIKKKTVHDPYTTGGQKWTEIHVWDHFLHTKANIEMIRDLHIIGGGPYVRWRVPSLGVGYAPLRYWTRKAKKTVDHKK